jgi:uncharacterized membrane protein HdeD (DUF308 family)
MRQIFQKVRHDMVYAAILQLGLGVLLVLDADKILPLICTVFGILVLVYGVCHLFSYYRKKKKQMEEPFELVQGIIGLAAGVFILVAAETIIKILLILFGIIIVIDSIVKIQDALDLKKLGHGSWLMMFLTAVVMAVMGILIIIKPAGLAAAIFMFAGIVMIINAAVDLWDIIYVSRKVKNLMK